ncbi:MAG: hypothetical protein A2Y97_07805 [Nitrospirae bacterium RBG_13_39_12]|nr:MAG: hypothetical protein A2Y97_07805 [Nitrospirae bacterium RBG_13_39_12]
MKALKILILTTLLLYIFPSIVLSEVIVHDMISVKGKKVMLTAETRGNFFTKGGETVEFYINKKIIGKTLSGGDGLAFTEFIPSYTGIYHITAKSGGDKSNGLLLSLKKDACIVFIDIEDSLFEGLFSKTPRTGSQKTIKIISGKFPVVFLQTGVFGTNTIKLWLKENKFIDSPVIPWRQGAIFDEISEKGLRIKAIIGSQSVIESAKTYKPKSFSFGETEDAEEVKDWEEIGKKLK